MVVHWRSARDYQAMCQNLGRQNLGRQNLGRQNLGRQNAGPLPFLQEALTIATFEPGMYEIVKSFEPGV